MHKIVEKKKYGAYKISVQKEEATIKGFSVEFFWLTFSTTSINLLLCTDLKIINSYGEFLIYSLISKIN